MKHDSSPSTENLLKDINCLLEAMLEVVKPDFLEITALLRSSDAQRIKDLPVLAEALQNIITELQYYDVICQKFKHMMDVHDVILNEIQGFRKPSMNHGTSVNLIRLNELQFQVACFEYLSSVNHIQVNLNRRDMSAFIKLPTDHNLFQHSSILLTASRKVKQNYELIAKIGHTAILLQPEKLALIQRIYSMQSERSVLETYLDKPMIADHEIEPSRQKRNDVDIDLF